MNDVIDCAEYIALKGDPSPAMLINDANGLIFRMMCRLHAEQAKSGEPVWIKPAKGDSFISIVRVDGETRLQCSAVFASEPGESLCVTPTA